MSWEEAFELQNKWLDKIIEFEDNHPLIDFTRHLLPGQTVVDVLVRSFIRGDGHQKSDILGMVPFIGPFCDGINCAWYLLEGDYKNAAWSAVAFVPIIGEVVILKYSDELVGMAKHGDELADGVDAISDVARYADNAEDLAKAYPDLNIPKGYEDYHTGRTEFKNLDEKLAMEEVMSNPQNGKNKIPELSDPNLPPPPNDWSKMEYIHYAEDGTKVTIHYDFNSSTNESLDFKIVFSE